MNACRSLGRLHFAFQFVYLDYLPLVSWPHCRSLGPKSVIADALTAVKMQLSCMRIGSTKIDRLWRRWRQLFLSCTFAKAPASALASSWSVKRGAWSMERCAVSAVQHPESSSFSLNIPERVAISFVYNDSMLTIAPAPAAATAAGAPGCRTHVVNGPERTLQSTRVQESKAVSCHLCMCVCLSVCVLALSAKCQRVLWHFFVWL